MSDGPRVRHSVGSVVMTVALVAAATTGGVAGGSASPVTASGRAAERPVERATQGATGRDDCTGNGCNGQPVSKRCRSDARQIAVKRFSQQSADGTQYRRAKLKLMKSRRCKTRWAQLTADAGGGHTVVSRTVALCEGAPLELTEVVANGPGSSSSMMFGSSRNIVACAYTQFGNPPYVVNLYAEP